MKGALRTEFIIIPEKILIYVENHNSSSQNILGIELAKWTDDLQKKLWEGGGELQFILSLNKNKIVLKERQGC